MGPKINWNFISKMGWFLVGAGCMRLGWFDHDGFNVPWGTLAIGLVTVFGSWLWQGGLEKVATIFRLLTDPVLGQWANDFRWTMNMMRVRRYRRKLPFSRRDAFDEALRPRLAADSTKLTYPDAIYYIQVEDLIRAIMAVP